MIITKRVAVTWYDCHESRLPRNMHFIYAVNLLQHTTTQTKVNNTIHLLSVVGYLKLYLGLTVCAQLAELSLARLTNYRARQLYKNISMLFLFPVKDGSLSTGVNATFDASCYG